VSYQSFSRRRFLKQTSLGLGWACAGLPGFAQEAMDNPPGSAPPRLGRGFLYGAHFYHPQSGPRPDQFRAMIEAIANQYQFNTLQVWSNWDYYNPAPGEYRFEDLEALLSLCDEFGVRVLMSVMLECAPYWLDQAHPETRYINAAGQAAHLGGHGGHYTGGAPGLCFDWEVVREAARDYVHALVKMAAPHRSLYAYDLWNEPANVDLEGRELDANLNLSENLYCYCDRSTTEFQNWLKRRYGSLDRFNDAWIRRYPSWQAIEPPRKPKETFAVWMDWRQFIQERITEYLKSRAQAVRDIDPQRLLETHVAYAPPSGPVTLRGVQPWRLAQEVQVFGCSFYPGGLATPLDQAAGEFDFVRSCAGNKAFWITEMQGGPIDGNPMPPRALRMWNWLAIASGAKGLSYWAYLTEGTGPEAPGFGLVARSGAPTERVQEAALTNRVIQARWELLKDYRPEPAVALLYDQDNPLLTFAKEATEEPATQSLQGYCKAFWQLDLPIDFIEPASVENAHHKVLVVPWHLIGKAATAEALRRFAERGGTVILESGFGRFDERYYANPVVPPHGLDEVFGYRERESLAVKDGKLPLGALEEAPSDAEAYEALMVFSAPFSQPRPLRIKAHTFLTPLELRSATPLATCHHWTVAARKAVGAGQVYYIGTNLGGAISAGESGGIELLRSIVSSLVQSKVTSSGALRPRLIAGPGRSLLTVFNDTEADQTATIRLTGHFKTAMDAYSGKRHAISANQFDVTVPFKNVAVLDLD